jgi:hypothetical protein
VSGNKVIVHKNRTNTLKVNLGIDVSGDTITSQIRAEPDHTSTLIAEWTVTNETDGVDGVLILTMDNTITSQITVDSGFMDLLRISGGEPLPVFDKPLEVSFRGTVTAEP